MKKFLTKLKNQKAVISQFAVKSTGKWRTLKRSHKIILMSTTGVIILVDRFQNNIPIKA